MDPHIQGDNTTIDRAKIVLKWLQEIEKIVPHLARSANSPDINVIVTFLDMLKRAVKIILNIHQIWLH